MTKQMKKNSIIFKAKAEFVAPRPTDAANDLYVKLMLEYLKTIYCKISTKPSLEYLIRPFFAAPNAALFL